MSLKHHGKTFSIGALLLVMLFQAAMQRLNATTYNVGSITDLTTRINGALPGDQIILSNGNYTTTGTINVSCAGTATQPILIAAQSIGGAQIGGQYGFNFVGASYITVQGFYFTYTNANVPGGLIVDTASTHCRITRNTFETDPIQYWCYVQGDDTEVDHNLFRNKLQKGEYVTLDGNHSTLWIAQRLWLHDNDFYNNEYAGGNGGESTRLGLGIWQQISGWSVVENNLYNQANGDPEAISVKNSDDVIRFNTLTNSSGEFNLRAQMRGRIEGNFIYNSGGIRFYDDDDLIFNNFLQRATNGIVIGSGENPEITDSCITCGLGAHAASHRVRIEFNTILNSPTYFDTDGRGYNPTDCIVENNILQGSSGVFVSSALAAGQTNFAWKSNIFWGGASLTGSPAGGYLNINPLLTTNQAALYRIASNSPAIGSSYAAPQEVVYDIDGQPRIGNPAIGVDEFAASPVTHHPLGTNDVGPYVLATNFAIVAMPWTQTVMPGLGTSYTNLLSAYNGFTNTVTLSVSNLPAGAGASFSQNSISNGIGFSVLSVTTSNATPPGRYTIQITATSAFFTNTTIACLTVGNLPSNWTDTDIGAPAIQGGADYYYYATNVLGVKASGSQISGASDQFNFAYQPWTNGLLLTAEVEAQPATSPSAKSGVMIRESTNANSKFVGVVVTPSSINMEARMTSGGSMLQLASYTAANTPVGTNSPSWVRLNLAGNAITGYASSDGVTWYQMGATNISMTNTLAGLVVCAYDNTRLNTTTFDKVNFLSTNNAPYISSQPANQNLIVGNNATFSVIAGGVLPLSYQWWFNTNTLLPSATNSSLAITNAQITNAGSYSVVVTNSYGSITSAFAVLSLNAPKTTNFTTPGTWTWTCPSNVFTVRADCWGGGGAGGSAFKSATSGTSSWGGGGAGGAYARRVSIPVTPGTDYTVSIGGGGSNNSLTLGFVGSGTNTTFIGDGGLIVMASGGQGGASAINSGGGAAGTGSTNGCIGDAGAVFAGGSGDAGSGTGSYGGGGGAGAGNNAAGASASVTTTNLGAIGANGGGSGGNGSLTGAPGTNGVAPGGGGGGGRSTGSSSGLQAGGAGGAGQVILTYFVAPTVSASAATGIALTNATLNGGALDNGNPISDRGFYYKTSSGVTTNDTRIAAGLGAGAFSATPALGSNTHYYWKAYAINLGGTTLSSELDFFTLAPVPPVFTNVSMSANASSFTLSGTGATNQSYVLQSATNLAPPVAWTGLATNSSGANGVFTFTDTQVTNFSQRFYRVSTP